jgi:hypothetical protein
MIPDRSPVKDASDSTRSALRGQARSVNFVWNYCRKVDREAQRRWKGGANVRRPSALDFIPFSNFDRPAKLQGSNLRVLGRTYRLWLSRPLPENGKPKSWEMSTDARGRWSSPLRAGLRFITKGPPRPLILSRHQGDYLAHRRCRCLKSRFERVLASIFGGGCARPRASERGAVDISLARRLISHRDGWVRHPMAVLAVQTSPPLPNREQKKSRIHDQP